MSEQPGIESRVIIPEATHAHYYRQTLEDACAVVHFAQRVCDDEELLQVVGQLARVLDLEDGADE